MTQSQIPAAADDFLEIVSKLNSGLVRYYDFTTLTLPAGTKFASTVSLKANSLSLNSSGFFINLSALFQETSFGFFALSMSIASGKNPAKLFFIKMDK
jgi:hypothetical protein